MLLFIGMDGKEGSNGGGWGQGRLKGGARRGVGMASVSERKENDCMRVSVEAQPADRFNVSGIDPVSHEGALIYSVL